MQQERILAGWSATIRLAGAIEARDAAGPADIPLDVVQIRPESQGFVYRLRLRLPPFTPEGLYHLRVEGPGFSDGRARAVRVLDAEATGLRLISIPGEAVGPAAEALWLLDPTALLVPGGMLDAERSLADWPVATFAVPDEGEAVARRCLVLSDDLARDAAAAASCSGSPENVARCLVNSLGGAASLEPCGDDLVTYARRAGMPSYVARLGDVLLVGINTSGGPSWQRADLDVRLGDDAVAIGRRPTASIGREQERWLSRMLSHGSAMDQILLSAAPLGALGLALPDPAGRRVEVAASSSPRGSGGATTIDLRPTRVPSGEDEEIWGLDPGGYRIGEVSESRALERPGVLVRDEPEGLLISMERPPPGPLRLRVVASGTKGWGVDGGRGVRIASISPAHGSPCEGGDVVLHLEVGTGPSAPLELRLRGVPRSPAPPTVAGPEEVAIGSPVTFEVSDGPWAAVLWDLGDGELAVGEKVTHRYRARGSRRVCVTAIDRGGAQAAPLTRDLVVHGQGDPVVAGGLAVGAAVALSILAIYLLVRRRGNILARRLR